MKDEVVQSEEVLSQALKALVKKRVSSFAQPDVIVVSPDYNPSYAVDQGPVVQSTVSLTSSLVIKMLAVLVSTISNSQVFLLKKCE